jgi:ABC-type transporter Mla subunit MlaD
MNADNEALSEALIERAAEIDAITEGEGTSALVNGLRQALGRLNAQLSIAGVKQVAQQFDETSGDVDTLLSGLQDRASRLDETNPGAGPIALNEGLQYVWEFLGARLALANARRLTTEMEERNARLLAQMQRLNDQRNE